MGNSTLKLKIRNIQWVSDKVVILEIDDEINGVISKEGNSIPEIAIQINPDYCCSKEVEVFLAICLHSRNYSAVVTFR